MNGFNPVSKSYGNHGSHKRIILYAAAFVHHQKNERETTIAMLKRAVGKMNWPQDTYYCFDLQLMKRKADEMIESGLIEVSSLP
ncbi:MAG: hypothetical protein KIY09_05020 [Thermoplasmata archaeon]|nr:hypothetical protein [Candidatus Sysuiplasma acidicola]